MKPDTIEQPGMYAILIFVIFALQAMVFPSIHREPADVLLCLFSIGGIWIYFYIQKYAFAARRYHGITEGLFLGSFPAALSEGSLSFRIILLAGTALAMTYFAIFYDSLPHVKERRQREAAEESRKEIDRKAEIARNQIEEMRRQDVERENSFANVSDPQYRSKSPERISETARRIAEQLKRR